MKITAYLLSLIVIAASCNSDEKKQEDAVVTPDAVDTTQGTKDSHYFWYADFDDKNSLIMKRSRPVSADSLDAKIVVEMLNTIYPDIPLNLVRVSHDSIFIDIKKSTYLTQRTGSTGAEAYLAEATYDLTEIQGINFVNFNFKKGDHASPGTYSRTDFVYEK